MVSEEKEILSKDLLALMMETPSPQSSTRDRDQAMREMDLELHLLIDEPGALDLGELIHLWDSDDLLLQYARRDWDKLSWAFRRVQLPEGAIHGALPTPNLTVLPYRYPALTILQSRATSLARSQRRLDAWAVHELYGLVLPEDLSQAPWYLRMFFKPILWAARRYLQQEDLCPVQVDPPGAQEARREMQAAWRQELRERRRVPPSWKWDEPELEDDEEPDDLSISGVWVCRKPDTKKDSEES